MSNPFSGGGGSSNVYRGGGGTSGGNTGSSSGYRGGGSGGSSSGYRGGRYNNYGGNSSGGGRWNQGSSSSSAGRGRGRGRGGRGGDGRSDGYIRARFNPCRTWTKTGSCPDPNCHFAHILKLHATVDASSYVMNESNAENPPHLNNSPQHHNNSNNNNGSQSKAAVESVSIWETNGQIKIFTGSLDGFWRLWNTSANFAKEFETKVGVKVCKIDVKNSFLFCGFEGFCNAVPDSSVGMLHAWNLAQPTLPPLELQMNKQFLPYAHNQSVTALEIHESTVVTGSRDGSIRVWAFSGTDFVLSMSLPGHSREVTGLVFVVPPEGSSPLLWSSSIDGSIRIWDLSSGECQYSIPKQSEQQQVIQPQTPPTTPGSGHTGAITTLISFLSPAHGPFILSASLDGSVKAWNGMTGECVASEVHGGEGVVSLAIVDASPVPNGPQILLAGLESGNIVGRNLMQTPTTTAFEALFVLNRINANHQGAVKCIVPGPSATFYTGGNDGNLMVWQVNGDLGLG